MLALPPALLDLLQMKVGAQVALAIDGGRLVIEPQSRNRFTMDELLAASDYAAPQPQEEREWVDAPPVGREIP